ncbi:MAG TPA: ACT domain-containing protein [Acidimicrobiia bacterium]|nr:ACT domain-containing protein [Acidimicrobiia bacterium]
MEVVRRALTYAYVQVPDEQASAWLGVAAAVVREDEGTTLLLPRIDAERAGLPWQFEAAWLTVRAVTGLAEVGVTARLAATLAEAGVPANVLAGASHDHVLVPAADAERAVAVLRAV